MGAAMHPAEPPPTESPLTAASLAPLSALMDLLGPSEAPALLRQLVEDLRTCDRMIGEALPAEDWHGLRQASHNLTALAGTAGATALQHLAEGLNRAAHARDRAVAVQLAKTARADLAGLVDLIRTLGREGEQR